MFLATIKVCCVRQLEKTKIACRNDKNLLCALGFKSKQISQNCRLAAAQLSGCSILPISKDRQNKETKINYEKTPSHSADDEYKTHYSGSKKEEFCSYQVKFELHAYILMNY